MRHFSLCEGAVANLFVIIILVLPDSDSTNPGVAKYWMANRHLKGYACYPWEAYRLSGLPRNEVGTLWTLPINHAAGTPTHQITLLVPRYAEVLEMLSASRQPF